MHAVILTQFIFSINWVMQKTIPSEAVQVGCTKLALLSKDTTLMAKAMAQKFTVAFMVLLLVTLVAPAAAKAHLAQDGILTNILGGGLLSVGGTLFCTLNGGIGVNGTATPVFANAVVQLTCGAGNIIATATTNGNGIFNILLNPLQFVLTSLISDCKLVVPTPLSTCNSALPAFGGLVSLLQSIGSILVGLLNITRLIPLGFSFDSLIG